MGILLNIPQSIKDSPGAATFERDMLFDIPFVADWKQIGEYRLHQTGCSNKRENSSRVIYDYKVGDKILIRKDGILVGPQFGMSPEPVRGSPYWNFDGNQFRDPRTSSGIAFFVFFSVTHKIGLFSTKIEVIHNAMAHLSSPKI